MRSIQAARLGVGLSVALGLGASVTALAQGAASPQIAGRYESSFGAMSLTESGGTYDATGARIVIERIDGNTVEGTWSQESATERCADGRFRGRFRFTFTAAGFTGRYGRCDEALTREWNGTRDTATSTVRPAPPAPPVAPPPVRARPRAPYETPDFDPLPRVGLAEPGWDSQLYQSLRASVETMARLREEGECNDYNRARRNFDGDLARAQQLATTQREIDGDHRAYFARRDVITNFQRWNHTLREAGCTSPTVAASRPPVPSAAALEPLSALPRAQADWHRATYEDLSATAMELDRLRTAGQCDNYWYRLRAFHESIEQSLEVALRQPPDRWSRSGPLYGFRGWIAASRRRGCGETARER